MDKPAARVRFPDGAEPAFRWPNQDGWDFDPRGFYLPPTERERSLAGVPE